MGDKGRGHNGVWTGSNKDGYGGGKGVDWGQGSGLGLESREWIGLGVKVGRFSYSQGQWGCQSGKGQERGKE